MLSLTRREGEQIRIGSAIVTVTAINGSRVKLGIEAPPDVLITRPDAHDEPERVLVPVGGGKQAYREVPAGYRVKREGRVETGDLVWVAPSGWRDAVGMVRSPIAVPWTVVTPIEESK